MPDQQQVEVPKHPSFWRRLFAFVGPAYLISVGYMDPGNWATDIAAGSRFGYRLLWVLVMSNLMALLLQSLSARLGIVTRLDLAQACHAMFHRRVSAVLWVLAEIAIAACDLAEVVGSAIGLQLLFGIPMIVGVFITAFDSLLLLVLHSRGVRMMEAFIVVLGSHGHRAVADFVRGTSVEKLRHRIGVPVLVVPAGGDGNPGVVKEP